MNTTVCVCVPDRWVRTWKIMWQLSFERIAFAHIRNLRHYPNGDFSEVSHRDCDGDTGILEIMRAYHDCGYTGYVRPDHGRHLWGEEAHCRPGYGLYDRALGIMYLWGCWDMLERLDGKI